MLHPSCSSLLPLSMSSRLLHSKSSKRLRKSQRYPKNTPPSYSQQISRLKPPYFPSSKTLHKPRNAFTQLCTNTLNVGRRSKGSPHLGFGCKASDDPPNSPSPLKRYLEIFPNDTKVRSEKVGEQCPAHCRVRIVPKKYASWWRNAFDWRW